MSKNLRTLSRNNQWEATGSGASVEEVNCGSFLRIADAMELMAKDRLQMERDLDWYKKKYAEKNEMIKRLEKSNAAFRGHIKRLKNKSKTNETI